MPEWGRVLTAPALDFNHTKAESYRRSQLAPAGSGYTIQDMAKKLYPYTPAPPPYLNAADAGKYKSTRYREKNICFAIICRELLRASDQVQWIPVVHRLITLTLLDRGCTSS